MNNQETNSEQSPALEQRSSEQVSLEANFNQLFSRNAIISKITAEQDYYLVEASMLTNKEFCTACAEGRGCGAIYLNDLTPLAKAKKKVLLTLDAQTMARDKLALGDVIKIATKKSNFFLLLVVFYLLPSLIFIFGAYIFSASELSAIVQSLIILILVAFYFLILKILLKSKEASVYYLHLEHRRAYSETYQAEERNNININGKDSQNTSQREYKGKIKEL